MFCVYFCLLFMFWSIHLLFCICFPIMRLSFCVCCFNVSCVFNWWCYVHLLFEDCLFCWIYLLFNNKTLFDMCVHVSYVWFQLISWIVMILKWDKAEWKLYWHCTQILIVLCMIYDICSCGFVVWCLLVLLVLLLSSKKKLRRPIEWFECVKFYKILCKQQRTSKSKMSSWIDVIRARNLLAMILHH